MKFLKTLGVGLAALAFSGLVLAQPVVVGGGGVVTSVGAGGTGNNCTVDASGNMVCAGKISTTTAGTSFQTSGTDGQFGITFGGNFGIYPNAGNSVLNLEAGASNVVTFIPNGATQFTFGIKGTGAGFTWGNGSTPFGFFAPPTISSGFGTGATNAGGNGTFAFTINVGTGGTASSGVIGMPTAITGWVCNCEDITTPGASITRQTGTSTASCTVTNALFGTGAATPWSASDKLSCTAMAY